MSELTKKLLIGVLFMVVSGEILDMYQVPGVLSFFASWVIGMIAMEVYEPVM